MIFNSNTTGLGTSIAPASGYDGAIGAARALVESARSDRSMFMAMLANDARELEARRSGYVNEAEITYINEAAVGGILSKIKEFFKKVAAKIKAIFHNFLAKFRSLYMSNKQLVKKYGNEVRRKDSINNLEIKWRANKSGASKIISDASKNISDLTIETINKSGTISLTDIINKGGPIDRLNNMYNDDSEIRFKNCASEINSSIFTNCNNESDLRESLDDNFWKDDSADTYQLKDSDIGGITTIISILENCDKNLKEIEKTARELDRAYENKIKEIDSKISEVNKLRDTEVDNSLNANGANKEKASDKAARLNQYYQVAVTCQNISTAITGWGFNTIKIAIAQAKAAFMKAVAASEKKLKESAFLDVFEETVKAEVEDVIDGAIGGSEGKDIKDLNFASTEVIENVKNDPDALTYDPDNYTEVDYKDGGCDGSVDSTIVGKSESAIFSARIY